MENKWWQTVIVYQVYPKSFYDSNGDGIGDLRGILQKLDYIAELGADVIWLCPVYASPMEDNGYDISDYRSISPLFGTMEDMDELIATAKKKGIRIIMDLVVNHTSDEHPWFVASKASQDNPYRDYYYWKKPAANGGPPNNWRSIFGGSAWEMDKTTGEYYLHVFAKKQPDLNWENPRVRQEVIEMVDWWLAKGIAGFRVDAITFLKKREDFVSLPLIQGERLASIARASMNQPGIHELLRELSDKCFCGGEVMTVAEAPGVAGSDLNRYIGDDGHFSMIFDFSHIDIDLVEGHMWYHPSGWTASDFMNAMEQGQMVSEQAGWGTLYLENHDQPRCLNKYLTEAAVSEKSAKMLAGLYFLMKGTPFIYQGQEIGMTNVKYETIEDYDDISSIDQYHSALQDGLSEQQALETLWRRSRDNSRTPMQWNAQEYAGFTKSTPWLKLNPNYHEVNVQQAQENENSLYWFYKKLIQLRKSSKYADLLTYGSFSRVMPEHPSIFAYLRTHRNEKLLIVADFGGQGGQLTTLDRVKECILTNNETAATDLEIGTNQLTLQAYDLYVLSLE